MNVIWAQIKSAEFLRRIWVLMYYRKCRKEHGYSIVKMEKRFRKED